jgi:predicted Zn finger-like uncharacterized protein
MFTRCPSCRTVFHITAAELRAADGMVICGACETTFDALESLSETRPAEPAASEPAAAPPVEEEAPPPIDGARDEEEFLEEIESLISDDDAEDTFPDDGRPMVATADEASLDGEPDEDVLLAEEAGDEEAGDEALFTDEPVTATSSGHDLEEDLEDGDELEYDLPDPDSVFRVDDFGTELPRRSTDPFVGEDDDQDSGETSPEDVRVSGYARLEDPSDATPEAVGPPAPDEQTGESMPADSMPAFVQEQRRGSVWLRVVLPLVAVAVLAGTWAHVQRGKLLRLPAGEAVLGPIYSLLGISAVPDWRPADFRVVRSEAIANADRPSELQVAVEFMNSAEFAQPYPTIRIVLQDRFGQRVGTHDFEPGQYLDSYTSGARLPGGDRMRASVSVPDPGGRADGFRVDLCLVLEGRGTVCSAEPFR